MKVRGFLQKLYEPCSSIFDQVNSVCKVYIYLSIVFCLLTSPSWHQASPALSVISPSFHAGIPILFNSLSIPILVLLPFVLLPSILPSITSFHKPLPPTVCPSYLFLVLLILSKQLFLFLYHYQHFFIFFPLYLAYFLHPSPQIHFKCLYPSSTIHL